MKSSLRSLAALALLAAPAHALPRVGGDHASETYACVTGYREVRGGGAVPFYEAIGVAGSYAGGPLAEIRLTREGVSVSVHADAHFRTVSVNGARTTVVTTDAEAWTQTTVFLRDGRATATRRRWSPVTGPDGPEEAAEPMQLRQIIEISVRTLAAVDRFCGSSGTDI